MRADDGLREAIRKIIDCFVALRPCANPLSFVAGDDGCATQLKTIMPPVEAGSITLLAQLLWDRALGQGTTGQHRELRLA
jgi:hypothetical protein